MIGPRPRNRATTAEIANRTRKTKNRILAISAAKPNSIDRPRIVAAKLAITESDMKQSLVTPSRLSMALKDAMSLGKK